MQVNELERLEGFVSRLLTGYKSLREKNERLAEELRARDEVIIRLRHDIENADREKSEIKGKVNRLVGRIDQWEKELIAAEAKPGTSDNNSGVQGALLVLGQDETVAEDE